MKLDKTNQGQKEVTLLPLWEHGLKQLIMALALQPKEELLPLWEHGLKHYHILIIDHFLTLLPLWEHGLKINNIITIDHFVTLLPLWEHGLKLYLHKEIFH